MEHKFIVEKNDTMREYFRRAKQGCEYDPINNRLIFANGNPHARADYIIGAKGQWMLCNSCAQLKIFNKYKIRKELNIQVINYRFQYELD